jgi:hypothetical protein
MTPFRRSPWHSATRQLGNSALDIDTRHSATRIALGTRQLGTRHLRSRSLMTPFRRTPWHSATRQLGSRHLVSALGTRQLASHSAHGNSALGNSATRHLASALGTRHLTSALGTRQLGNSALGVGNRHLALDIGTRHPATCHSATRHWFRFRLVFQLFLHFVDRRVTQIWPFLFLKIRGKNAIFLF